MAELSAAKQALLDAQGHILAMGGPGSGKTYIALRKAQQEIPALKRGQRVLFLSFARATIARVAEQARQIIDVSGRGSLEINTYHGFTWNLLRSHGYLLSRHAPLRLLPPPEAASRFADVAPANRIIEHRRLFDEEGLLHFDLFAPMAAELLAKSSKLRMIVCGVYPFIVFDEFQDTNPDEWRMIQSLGAGSRLMALADPDQRIYEFRGADPRRIGDFATQFSPVQFDFGMENHRSNGTDIAEFGNDLLTGANQKKVYRNVKVARYPYRAGQAVHADLKWSVLGSIGRVKGKRGWSIAVLVPSKSLMVDVSDYLGGEQTFGKGDQVLPILAHDVALETTGPALAAGVIACLLEGGMSSQSIAHRLVQELVAYLRGRRGESSPNKSEMELTGVLDAYLKNGIGRKQKKLLVELEQVANKRFNMALSGDPGEDWLSSRRLLASCNSDLCTEVAQDASYLRLLHKGAVLRARLSSLWRAHHDYVGASDAVSAALLQEHFAASTKVWTGLNVMTIHKSKGKEFDEVIIYEGLYKGRIVRRGASDRDKAQARLSLRVAVTRAKSRTTILTPKGDSCTFL